MKKKWLMFGSAVGISSVVMVTTGLSAMAGSSGYDAYKSALKNTKTLKSVSVQAEAILQDNGNVLANAKGSLKASMENHTGSGTVTLTSNGTEKSASFYKQENGTVVKPGDSDVYYVQQNEKDKRKKFKEHNDQEMSQQVETVIDALVGNLKDYVSVDTKSDGSKEVSVQLANDQIPAVLNAIAPIAVKKATSEHKDRIGKKNQDEFPLGKDLLTNVPQLSQDIKIENIALKASINASNYIEHQEADITVSGKDANGSAHEVTLHLNADLSGYNSTAPDQVDLTGKNVQTIKHNHKGKHEENE